MPFSAVKGTLAGLGRAGPSFGRPLPASAGTWPGRPGLGRVGPSAGSGPGLGRVWAGSGPGLGRVGAGSGPGLGRVGAGSGPGRVRVGAGSGPVGREFVGV